MLRGSDACDETAKSIVDFLSDHSETKAHARHIGIRECERIGLKIERLEDDNDFQDAVLSVHHAFILTFLNSAAIKILENNDGTRMIFQSGKLPQQQSQSKPVQSET